MLRLLILGLLWVGLATGVAAQNDETGIQATITRQIEAFSNDDVVTAFTFASPGIQSMFGTPDRFGAMVKTGYPMVWRQQEFTFAPLVLHQNKTIQPVIFTDISGRLHVLDYEMLDQGGIWKINGVSRRKSLGA